MSFNKNFFITISFLFISIIILNFQVHFTGNLILIFIIYIFVFGLPSAFVFKDATDYYLITALSILPFIFWFKTHNPYIIKTPIFYIFMTLALISFIRTKKKLMFNFFDIIVFSGLIFMFIYSSIGKYYNARFSELSIQLNSFFLVYLLVRFSKSKIKIANFLIYIGTIISLYGIIQWMGQDPFVPGERFSIPFKSRIIGTLGNPNFFSGYLIGIFSLTFYLFLQNKKKLFLFASIIQFIALLATGTRGVFIAFLFSLLLLVIYNKNIKKFIIPILLFIALLFIVPSMRQRMITAPSQILNKKGSLGQRELMWKTALSMIKNRPLGIGLAGYRLFYPDYQGRNLDDPAFLILSTHARHPHNQCLEWATAGSIFLFFWYMFLGIFVIMVFSKIKDKSYYAAFAFSFIVIFIHNLISVVINYEPPLSNLGFMLAGISFILGKEKFKISKNFLLIPLVLNIIFIPMWWKKVIGSYYFAQGVGYINLYQERQDPNFLKDANKKLKQSSRYDNRFVNTWYRIGNSYTLLAKKAGEEKERIKYLEKAVKYLKKADSLKPSYYEIRYNIGLALINLRRYDEADRYLKSAMEIEPYKLNIIRQWCELFIGKNRDLSNKKNLSEIEKRLNYLRKSIELQEKSLNYLSGGKKDISNSEILTSKLYLSKQLGFINYKTENYKNAADYFLKGYNIAKSVKKENEIKLFLNNLLAIARRQKDISLEKKYLDLLTNHFPHSAEVYLEKAIYSIKYGNQKLGIDMINKLLERAKEEKVKNRIYTRVLKNGDFSIFKNLNCSSKIKTLAKYIEVNGVNKNDLNKKFPTLKEIINGL